MRVRVCACVCEEGVSGHICMNACLKAIQVEVVYVLILHLHSDLQIKAKNYDKVEKVSVHRTHPSRPVCHCKMSTIIKCPLNSTL